MIDIKFLRENPEVVKENIRKKFEDHKLPLVDEVVKLDQRNREIKQELQALQAQSNQAAKKIGGLMKQGLKAEAEAKKARDRVVGNLFNSVVGSIGREAGRQITRGIFGTRR